jgi:hypothetical protein
MIGRLLGAIAGSGAGGIVGLVLLALVWSGSGCWWPGSRRG